MEHPSPFSFRRESRARRLPPRVPATLGHVSRIVRASPIVFVRRLPPADMHAPLRGVARGLGHVPVLFSDAELVDERYSVPICCSLGRFAPNTRLKPHDFRVLNGRFIDV